MRHVFIEGFDRLLGAGPAMRQFPRKKRLHAQTIAAFIGGLTMLALICVILNFLN